MEIALSQPILDEVLRVLSEKFERSDSDLAHYETWIRQFTRFVMPTRTVEAVPDDPDDNRIVECAVASGSDCIVTGDNDLLRLGQFEGIQILRLSDYLARERAR